MKSSYILFLVIFYVCSDSLVGMAQTLDVNEGCLPLTVNFTAPPGYPTHFWDFGDGSSSTITNPSNTYLNAGTYTASFKETATGPTIGTLTINVYPQPVPTFTTVNDQGCIPLTVGFTNTTVLNSGITLNSLSWVFSDGGNTTGQSPNHTFTSPGSFNVSLSLTTNFPSCNTSSQYNNIIHCSAPPNMGISTNPSPPVGCTAPLTVSFQNTTTSAWGPLTYHWDMGNTATSTATDPPNQSYNDGVYVVWLTATDTLGCVDSVSQVVSVGGSTADFDVDDTLCINTQYLLTNLSSPGNYTWSVAPGGGTFFDAGPNYSVYFTTPGYHDITLDVYNNCPADTTITVFVEEIDASFISIPTFSCDTPLVAQFIPNNQNYVDYSWFFASGDTSSALTPSTTFTYEDTSYYSVNGAKYFGATLIATSSAGCTGTFTLFDTIRLPNALLSPDVVDGCAPLTVTFIDNSVSHSSIVNWEIHFGDGTVVTNTTSQDETHVYSSPGTYDAYVIITDANGCVDTSIVSTINVGASITPDFTVSNTDICPGDTIQFTDITTGPFADSIDTWHYYSENSRQFSCSDNPDPTWAYYHETGPQDITMVVEYNGCQSQITKTAFVNVNGPVAKLHYIIDCDTPMVVNYIDSSQQATSLFWDFGDNTTSSAFNPAKTYSNTGDYNVTVIASNPSTGCPDDTATALVHVRNLSASFTVDSLFCQGLPYDLDATNSVDVLEECGRGYTWFFSDPSVRPQTTESPNDQVTLNQTGVNQIMLVVRDINNCVDTAITYVNVYGITADFSIPDTSVCLPLTMTYSDLSVSDTTINSWTWTFPDYSTSLMQNPNHTIPEAIFLNDSTTILMVENVLGCTSSDTLKMFFYDPQSIVTISDQTVCTGEVVNFQATDFTTYNSYLTYNWDFGDGNIGLAQNSTNTYANPGSYSVILTYTEAASGCSNDTLVQVNVADFPTAGFMTSVDSIQYVCPGENIIMTDTSDYTNAPVFNWDFGNGLSSTLMNPGTVYDSNGVYTIQLIVSVASPYGCSDTITGTVVVQQPYGDFIADIGEDTICRLDTVVFEIIDTSSVGLYYWDFGDGTGAGMVSPVSNQYTFVPPSGQTFAKLIMSNYDGSCPITQSIPINIFDVRADFIRNGNDIDTAMCLQPVPLTNASTNANVFFWDFGDGTTSTLPHVGTHTYDTSGTYYITLGVQNGQLTCTDTITKAIILYDNPIASIVGDTICEGEVVNLHSLHTHPTYSYLWTSNPTFLVNNDTTPSVYDIPSTTTNYYLTITDTNNCTASDFATVMVFNPIILPDFDTVIVIGDSITLPMPYNTDWYIFSWDPSYGLSCTDCPTPTIQPLENTIYTLSIEDKFGCFSTEVSYIIDIHPETFISLPTTFTPNGDGNNDLIFVEGWGIKELLEYKIFNRWGELVFETNDLSVGWNGYYKGMLQNNDVYLVQVRVITWKDEEKSFEGYINLMR